MNVDIQAFHDYLSLLPILIIKYRYVIFLLKYLFFEKNNLNEAKNVLLR